MTIKELEKKACQNKAKAIENSRESLKDQFKSLYKDCEDDLKEDRENPPFVFPDGYTAFDLFVDNLVEIVQDTEKFSEIDFIELAKDLHTAKNTDIKEYFY